MCVTRLSTRVSHRRRRRGAGICHGEEIRELQEHLFGVKIAVVHPELGVAVVHRHRHKCFRRSLLTAVDTNHRGSVGDTTISFISRKGSGLCQVLVGNLHIGSHVLHDAGYRAGQYRDFCIAGGNRGLDETEFLCVRVQLEQATQLHNICQRLGSNIRVTQRKNRSRLLILLGFGLT